MFIKIYYDDYFNQQVYYFDLKNINSVLIDDTVIKIELKNGNVFERCMSKYITIELAMGRV